MTLFNTESRVAGFPSTAMGVLAALYHKTVGALLLHGRLYEDVALEAGIRQGCPLSPLLFALASDSLLRILELRHPSATTRAFADDTAMVLRSWARDHKKVFATFKVFETLSNLSLNLAKTIVIPLWDADVAQLQRDTDGDPSSVQISWDTTGKYLGFYIGPGKGTKSWSKPADKYLERLQQWQWSELGLHLAMMTYNVFVLPVLLFVAQLEAPPQAVLEMEAAAVRKVAPGPGWWCTPADMQHGSELGLSARMRHLRASCQAAMLRTHAWEARSTGGIPWNQLSRQLTEARARADHLTLRRCCLPWFAQHTPTVVTKLVDAQAAEGVHVHAARSALGGAIVGPLTRPADQRFKKGTQKWMTERLVAQDKYCVERRLRARLARWRLPDYPGRTARRAARQLVRLRRLVPPRLCAATLSTIFNRWTTDRRMRSLRDNQRPCVLGCSTTACDSVEHYFHCPVWLDWQRSRLGHSVTHHRLAHAVLGVDMGDQALCLQAVSTYVLYRTVNHIRHRRFRDAQARSAYIKQFMNQLLHEACRGHARLRQVCQGSGSARPVRRPRAEEAAARPARRVRRRLQ